MTPFYAVLCSSKANLLVVPYLEPLEIGRREWTRTIDPHHVKVSVMSAQRALARLRTTP